MAYPPPFTLQKRDLAARVKWAKAAYRKRTNGKYWLPSAGDRICSIHFIDGKPTAAHPQFSRKPSKLRQEPA